MFMHSETQGCLNVVFFNQQVHKSIIRKYGRFAIVILDVFEKFISFIGLTKAYPTCDQFNKNRLTKEMVIVFHVLQRSLRILELPRVTQ